MHSYKLVDVRHEISYNSVTIPADEVTDLSSAKLRPAKLFSASKLWKPIFGFWY